MDHNDIARQLSKYEPGFLPYPVFEQIARLVALPILEVIPLRKNKGVVEVLLIKRAEDDLLFTGMLHTPGTVIRATDNNPGHGIWKPLERILNEELIGTEVGPIQFVGSMLHASKRGVEQAQLYWVEVLSEPHIGEFYKVDDLPSNTMESQLDFIKLAAQKFSLA